MAYKLQTNRIICGDCEDVLKKLPDNSIDLIYIDPPFNSSRNYEVFWGDVQEKRAFEDHFGDAQAYIDYMRPRIMELYRVLKETGSFYYHCDWHASHYVKVMLDEIFGFGFFRNEIIWYYTGWNAILKENFNRRHDSIFYYSKSKDVKFNSYSLPWQSEEEYVKIRKQKIREDEKGKYVLSDAGGGKRVKRYLKEAMKYGKPVDDVWIIDKLTSSSNERLGYPTQKPLALLDRIISASSNKGDIVLDAFCGCGTTLAAAQNLKRKWIGIDISPTACRVVADRLEDTLGLIEGEDFKVYDTPRGADELRKMPPFEFENWAVLAIGGIPNKKKVADFGIDGKLYPIDHGKEKKTDLFEEAEDYYYPIQVKQKDKAGRPDIDAFETAIRRDKRRKGYFISFDFTKDAITEIKRLDKEGEIEIIPISVEQILKKGEYSV